MATLYELDKAIEDFELEIDEETGEITNMDDLDALNMERDQKIENIALWHKNLKADASAIKDEAKNLMARATAAEKKADRLKEYLTYQLAGKKFNSPNAAGEATPRSTTSTGAPTATSASKMASWCIYATSTTGGTKARTTTRTYSSGSGGNAKAVMKRITAGRSSWTGSGGITLSKIWIEYGSDGLPVRVTDTAGEMAKEANTNVNNVRSAASHGKHRDQVRFRSVEVEDE